MNDKQLENTQQGIKNALAMGVPLHIATYLERVLQDPQEAVDNHQTTVDSIAQHMLEWKQGALEGLCKEFLAETGLKAEDIALVQTMGTGEDEQKVFLYFDLRPNHVKDRIDFPEVMKKLREEMNDPRLMDPTADDYPPIDYRKDGIPTDILPVPKDLHNVD